MSRGRSSGPKIGNATRSANCRNRGLKRVTTKFSCELANNLSNDIVALTLDIADESFEEGNLRLSSVGVVPIVFRAHGGIRADRDLEIFKVVQINLAGDIETEGFARVQEGVVRWE